MKIKGLWATTVVSCLMFGHPTSAHEPVDLNKLMKDFGADLNNATVRVQTLTPGMHVLFGIGGNVVASVGDDGVLLVDDQFPELVPKLTDAIAKLGGGDVDFVINTHWHFDHADGNPALGAAGAWIVSQTNSRRMMMDNRLVNLVGAVYEQPAYPPEGRPVITYDRSMRFHFNGQTIELLHFGPAHTTGDTMVFFRDANVVHMGDVFNNTGYPFIDADNGGDIRGVITSCEAILEVINEQTMVVPGHGAVATHADLVSYVNMLTVVSDRISRMIDSGMTLQEVVAEGPTKDFDARYGARSQTLIDRAYSSLSRER